MIRSVHALPVVLISFLLSGAPLYAQIRVHGTVNGVDTEIGFLEPTISDGADGKYEKSIFDLHPDYEFLMNDAMGCQFRYFQVAIADNDPQRPQMTNGMLPGIPYVDPPNGGYLGQTSSMGNGADHSPFYENDDGAGPYAFQRYSDVFNSADSAFPDNTPVHDPATGAVNTDDFPDVSDNARVDFETYIVFVDDEMRAQRTFDVLAGFGWGVFRTNDELHLDGMGPNIPTIDALRLANLNASLGNSMFADWTVATGLEINTCIPEPATVGLCLIGIAMLLACNRSLSLEA